jgi:glycosyltransferase involved in cell wall biosynthesis
MRWRRWKVGLRNQQITRQVIRAEKPDIIFFWSQLRLTLGSMRAAQESDLPIACTLNDEHLAGYVATSWGWKPRQLAGFVLDNWILSRNTTRGLNFRHTTCISRLLKENLESQGVPIPASEVIYQGIPISRFPCKEQIGKINRPTRLLYAGQLHHYKGVHTLLQAANRIADMRGPDQVEVSIAGDGEKAYVDYLHQLARGSAARIRFLGRVPHTELPAIYRSHDIFVFPSIWQEPFGLTHLEAMASGTPVISTDSGGHREFIKDGENALVFDKDDEESLLDKKMVECDFSLERYVDSIEDWLHRVKNQEEAA